MTPRGGAKANVGDIAYYANGKVNVVSPDAWDASLGTPVGVVVIPSGFAPDNGKARIISLYWADPNGTSNASSQTLSWGSSVASGLLSGGYMPTTNNASSAIEYSANNGYLPSDYITGEQSYFDPKANYGSYATKIISPYLGERPNPAYYAEVAGGNVLSDFNGKGNTDFLVTQGGTEAARAAKRYKAAGAEHIEWYLPTAGEIGYMVARLEQLYKILSKMGAATLSVSTYYWTSSEYSSALAYCCRPNTGRLYGRPKDDFLAVRPFAQLDF